MKPDTLVSAGRLCALSAAVFLCARARIDPDLFGHLRFGLDLLQSGQLTTVDPYSFTQDVPWVNHEWLSELLFGAAYRIGGVAGLVVLKTLVLGSAAWLLDGVTREAALRVRWWLLALAVAGLTPAAMTVRPQLWTILALAALSRMLVGRASLLWAIPLFALWANLHGGWVVGVGVSGLWLVGRAVDLRGVRALIASAATLAAAVAATLVTPYGWRLWAFILATVRMERNITEWRPLWEQADVQDGLLWAAFVAVVLFTLAKRWRAVSWSALLPVLWLGASGLMVDRLTPLFAEMSLLLLAPAWRRTGADDAPAVPPRPVGMLVIDAMMVAAVWAFGAVDASRCLPITGDWAPDLVAASTFTESKVEGRLVLPFNWGEYAIWHWGPELKVSTDGRRETVYSEAVVNLQASAAAGRPEGLEYLREARPDYVWLPAVTGATTATWLREHGYRIDVSTKDSFIATRADLQPLPFPKRRMSACFP